MNIGFVSTDHDEYVSLDFSRVNDKFYIHLSTYREGDDGHHHETGDGITIRVDQLENFVNELLNIVTVLPRELGKQTNTKRGYRHRMSGVEESKNSPPACPTYPFGNE